MIINREKYLQELVSSRHNGLVKIISLYRQFHEIRNHWRHQQKIRHCINERV